MKLSRIEIINEAIKIVENQIRVAKETQDYFHLHNMSKLLIDLAILRDGVK